MKEAVTIIEGPIPPLPQNLLRWESLFRITYSVSLDNGLIVTNPDQFPERPSTNVETTHAIDE